MLSSDGCPYQKEGSCAYGSSENVDEHINPNPEDQHETVLSIERETSSIPKSIPSNAAQPPSRWQYPSPLQFYRALRRKGHTDTTASQIPAMLYIHNELNERVWQEILAWEASHSLRNEGPCSGIPPRLRSFQGRPQELSPRAWWYSKVHGVPEPFDRHDWIIERCGGRRLRYVIDYYPGHPEDDHAVFNVDVRPALDSVDAAWMRIKKWWNS